MESLIQPLKVQEIPIPVLEDYGEQDGEYSNTVAVTDSHEESSEAVEESSSAETNKATEADNNEEESGRGAKRKTDDEKGNTATSGQRQKVSPSCAICGACCTVVLIAHMCSYMFPLSLQKKLLF